MAQREADGLPLPNWDEFDPAEELDYTEDPHDGESSMDDAGPEMLIGPSFPAFIEEPHASSQRNGQISNDGLPGVPSDVPQPNSRVVIGPALPPCLHLADDSAPEDPSNDPEDPELDAPSARAVGPTLPQFLSAPGPSSSRSRIPTAPFNRPVAVIGTAIPGHLLESGPSLPDDELKNFGSGPSSQRGPPPEPMETRSIVESSIRTVGPALPPDLLPENSNDADYDDDDSYGPLPPPPNGSSVPDMPYDVDDEEDEVIGPMPCTGSMDEAATDYALRRLELERQKELASGSKNKREEWMTSLPTKLTNYGLGARSFSKSTSTAERDNSWTEGPNAAPGPSTSEADAPSQQCIANRLRDEEQAKIADALNASNKKDSLLDSHNRKRKTDTSDESGPSSSRKPFDREKDMAVTGLKNASVAEIKERCGQLTSRFGSGNSQKFL